MLHVHRSDRADGLVAALRELLAAPPDDPFAREVVAVPTRGMERWLTQRMAAVLGASPGRADGVCANVEFPFPRRLTAAAVAAAAGIDPEADPWLPERLVWPLLEVVDASLDEPWLRALAAHIEAHPARRWRPAPAAQMEATGGRRFPAVRHIASLFDRYALYRPGWEADHAGHW